MNRSILIAVCDFLILSILSMGTFNESFNNGSSGNGNNLNSGIPLQQDIMDSIELVMQKEEESQNKLHETIQNMEIAIQQATEKQTMLQQQLESIEKTKKGLEIELKERDKNLEGKHQKLSKIQKQLDLQEQKAIELQQQLSEQMTMTKDLEKDLEYKKKEVSEKDKKLSLLEENFNQSLRSIENLSGELSTSQKHARNLEQQLLTYNRDLQQKDLALNETKKEMSQLLNQKLEQEKINQKLLDDIEKQESMVSNIQKKLQEKILESQINQNRNAYSQDQITKLEQQLKTREQELSELNRTKFNQEKEMELLRERISNSQMTEQNLMDDLSRLKEEKTSLLQKHEDLTQKVTKIAENSVEVQKKLLDSSQVYSNNDLFQMYQNNKLELVFQANGQWLFSPVTFKTKESVIGVKKGELKGFVLFYKKTPLKWIHFSRMEHLEMFVSPPDRNELIPIQSIAVLASDPRLVFLKIEKEIPGINFFTAEESLPKTDEALLIRGDEGLYGSFPLTLLAGKTSQFQVPSSLSSRMFGSFSPVAGDFVLSPSGKILGAMVDHELAILLNDLSYHEIFFSGPTAPSQHEQNFYAWRRRLEAIIFPQENN